jgi:hypothetical protein
VTDEVELVLASAGSIALTARSVELAPVRLLGVSAQGSAIVIEASEPVAYVVSRPDPLTVVVELREATVAEATNQVTPRSRGGVTLGDGTAVDGKAVLRPRARETNGIEGAQRAQHDPPRFPGHSGAEEPSPRGGCAADPRCPTAAAPAEAPPEPRGDAHRRRAPSCRRRHDRTLTGNGLAPTAVTETRSRRSAWSSFAGVASQAAVQTNVDSAVVARPRRPPQPIAADDPRGDEIADTTTSNGRRRRTQPRDRVRGGARRPVTVGTPGASADVTPDVMPLQQALASGGARAAGRSVGSTR